jgi:hypothetical protein
MGAAARTRRFRRGCGPNRPGRASSRERSVRRQRSRLGRIGSAFRPARVDAKSLHRCVPHAGLAGTTLFASRGPTSSVGHAQTGSSNMRSSRPRPRETPHRPAFTICFQLTADSSTQDTGEPVLTRRCSSGARLRTIRSTRKAIPTSIENWPARERLPGYETESGRLRHGGQHVSSGAER